MGRDEPTNDTDPFLALRVSLEYLKAEAHMLGLLEVAGLIEEAKQRLEKEAPPPTGHC